MSVSNFFILVSMTAGIYLALKLVVTELSYYVMRLQKRNRTLAFLMGAAIWGALWMILFGFELMVRTCLGLVPKHYAIVAFFLLGGGAILGIQVLLFPSLDRYLGPDEVKP